MQIKITEIPIYLIGKNSLKLKALQKIWQINVFALLLFLFTVDGSLEIIRLSFYFWSFLRFSEFIASPTRHLWKVMPDRLKHFFTNFISLIHSLDRNRLQYNICFYKETLFLKIVKKTFRILPVKVINCNSLWLPNVERNWL